MARFVINNKVYDTEKMELIGTVRKWYPFDSWILQHLYGEDVGQNYDCQLYRSHKGNWLLVHSGDIDLAGEAIKECEAKELLMHSDYDTYVALFNPLEEA